MSDISHQDAPEPEAPLAVIALSGDPALSWSSDGDPRDAHRAAARAAKAVVTLVREGLREVVEPAGAPGLRRELIRNEEAATKLAPSSMGEAAAATQAVVAQRLEAAMRNALRQEQLRGEVASLTSQILVASDDASFDAPTRHVGPALSSWRAKELSKAKGVHVVEEAAKGWRRIVAEPAPVEVLGLGAIEVLLNHGHVVLTAAGGGVPVAIDGRSQLNDAEGLVSEVQVATLIANELAANLLILMLPTEHLPTYAGQVNQGRVEAATRHDLRELLEAGAFASPENLRRVESALDFLDAGGEMVLLSVAQKLPAALAGRSGTRVARDASVGKSTKQISLFASQSGADSSATDSTATGGLP